MQQGNWWTSGQLSFFFVGGWWSESFRLGVLQNVSQGPKAEVLPWETIPKRPAVVGCGVSTLQFHLSGPGGSPYSSPNKSWIVLCKKGASLEREKALARAVGRLTKAGRANFLWGGAPFHFLESENPEMTVEGQAFSSEGWEGEVKSQCSGSPFPWESWLTREKDSQNNSPTCGWQKVSWCPRA